MDDEMQKQAQALAQGLAWLAGNGRAAADLVSEELKKWPNRDAWFEEALSWLVSIE
jgi:hypothetical protein